MAILNEEDVAPDASRHIDEEPLATSVPSTPPAPTVVGQGSGMQGVSEAAAVPISLPPLKLGAAFGKPRSSDGLKRQQTTEAHAKKDGGHGAVGVSNGQNGNPGVDGDGGSGSRSKPSPLGPLRSESHGASISPHGLAAHDVVSAVPSMVPLMALSPHAPSVVHREGAHRGAVSGDAVVTKVAQVVD